MNNWIGIGRLTKEPESKATPSGVTVAVFALAVDRRFKDKNGERQTDFISCVAWRQQADFIAKYIKKGTKIVVQGELQTRTYEKEGHKVYITEVVVSDIEFAESKRNDADSTQNDDEPFNL